MSQSHLADLFRQVVSVAANFWSVRNRTTNKDRRIPGTVTRAAGTFLADILLRGAADFAAGLGLVRTSLALGQLPANRALQDVTTDVFDAEDGIINRDVSSGFAGKGFDCEFHYSAPS